MTNFNSDLNSLFKNFQKQNTYSKYEKASEKDKKNKALWTSIDTNKDGKINETDKSKFDLNETKLLKKENLFDVNADGKLNQKDVDMFIKGDVNGDGKVSADEKAFIKEYKVDLISALSGAKTTFKIDGKQYVKGKLAEELYDGKYYKNGLLYTGDVKEGKEKKITYKDGVKESIIQYQYIGNQKVSAEKEFFDVSGNVTKKKTYLYKNGEGIANSVVTYKYNSNNQLISSVNYNYDENGNAVKFATNEYSYKNDGEPKSITTKVYANGDYKNPIATAVNSYLIDNNVNPYMSATPEGIVINFKDGKTLTLKNGQTADITTDGNHIVKITSKDGKKSAIYKNDGQIKSKSPKTYKPEEPKIPTQRESVDSTKVVNGLVTIKTEKDINNKLISITETTKTSDGKTASKIVREYNDDGTKIVKTTIIEYQADGTTKKSQKTISENGEIDERTFNEKGGKLTVKKTNSYGAYLTSTFTYEADGKTIKTETRKDYTANNVQRTNIIIKYKSGKKSSQTRDVYNPTTKKKNRYCTYEYDNNGNKIKETVIRYDSNSKKTGSTIYSYDYKEKKVTITSYDKNGKEINKEVNNM